MENSVRPADFSFDRCQGTVQSMCGVILRCTQAPGGSGRATRCALRSPFSNPAAPHAVEPPARCALRSLLAASPLVPSAASLAHGSRRSPFTHSAALPLVSPPAGRPHAACSSAWVAGRPRAGCRRRRQPIGAAASPRRSRPRAKSHSIRLAEERIVAWRSVGRPV
jgi:hypothetical protein